MLNPNGRAVYFKVFTQNLEKPLAPDRYLSYRTNLTFSGICQYLLALLVTFILLNENINAWSCQWSSYKDNSWSHNTINYIDIVQLQTSRAPDNQIINQYYSHNLPKEKIKPLLEEKYFYGNNCLITLLNAIPANHTSSTKLLECFANAFALQHFQLLKPCTNYVLILFISVWAIL